MIRQRFAHIARALCAITIVLEFLACSDSRPLSPEKSKPAADPVILACEGRVEGNTDTANVGAAADGVIEKVYVKEGDQVPMGTIMAEIGCEDVEADLRQANSMAESVRQARVRLLRASREEQRKAATQKTIAAAAVLKREEARLARARSLFQEGIISRDEYDSAIRDDEVASAELNNAREQENLTDAGPLPEELARADADIKAAEHHVSFDQERLRKCKVRAPYTGTVLRVLARPGETFSTVAPRPLFLLTDMSSRRVRAEIDEQDIGKIFVGQHASVVADAFGKEEFTGIVERIAPVMGRKTVVSANPAEKSDRDVLEAIIRVDGASQLPIGLRVLVRLAKQ
jgi:HlyD family secretion protein